jgi:hypothetical protein
MMRKVFTRGANINNILNFQKDYDGVKTFRLEQNYRSTKNIVEAANTIIDKNKVKLDKIVWTANDFGKNKSAPQHDRCRGRAFCSQHDFRTKNAKPTVTALLPFYIVPMRNPVLWKMHLEKRYSVSHLWWFIFYQGKK